MLCETRLVGIFLLTKKLKGRKKESKKKRTLAISNECPLKNQGEGKKSRVLGVIPWCEKCDGWKKPSMNCLGNATNKCKAQPPSSTWSIYNALLSVVFVGIFYRISFVWIWICHTKM